MKKRDELDGRADEWRGERCETGVVTAGESGDIWGPHGSEHSVQYAKLSFLSSAKWWKVHMQGKVTCSRIQTTSTTASGLLVDCVHLKVLFLYVSLMRYACLSVCLFQCLRV